MIISSALKKYTLDFSNSLDEIRDLQKNTDVYFVIDRNVYELYKNLLPEFQARQLSMIDALESNKNIDTALSICEKMTQFTSKRNTILVAIGGGIIQDIAGFVANMLYRGIQWLYFPTTLLASCDSCIGGKSSLNYKTFKNLFGSFYPPDRIVIYPDFFSTLSLGDYCSGLGEIVKFNIIIGEKGMSELESKIDALLARDYAVLLSFINTSLSLKKVFVEEDEFDKGRRILLNYGHTFGHAIETASSYQIPHGTAVVLGILIANAISLQRSILEGETSNKIENICRKIVTIYLQNEWFDIDNIINAVKKDKKQTDASLKAILLKSDYSLGIYNDITINEISRAVQYILSISKIIDTTGGGGAPPARRRDHQYRESEIR
jgi:3-dehydroquinate synthase